MAAVAAAAAAAAARYKSPADNCTSRFSRLVDILLDLNPKYFHFHPLAISLSVELKYLFGSYGKDSKPLSPPLSPCSESPEFQAHLSWQFEMKFYCCQSFSNLSKLQNFPRLFSHLASFSTPFPSWLLASRST